MKVQFRTISQPYNQTKNSNKSNDVHFGFNPKKFTEKVIKETEGKTYNEIKDLIDINSLKQNIFENEFELLNMEKLFTEEHTKKKLKLRTKILKLKLKINLLMKESNKALFKKD